MREMRDDITHKFHDVDEVPHLSSVPMMFAEIRPTSIGLETTHGVGREHGVLVVARVVVARMGLALLARRVVVESIRHSAASTQQLSRSVPACSAPRELCHLVTRSPVL